ncbi:MAG: sterol desaturase family protein [Deltaproteobacteria bacterium]|nr:sterol desaturase family protein [Deltaproteobacteria bacterium]
MKLELITLSVPLFFIGILIELAFNKAWSRGYYVLGDSLASLGTGVLDQVLISITRVMMFTLPYVWIYEHLAPTHFEEATVPVLLGGLLLADFGYYWAHRFSHEISFLWAGHVVHHSSEEYNLTTGLRQNWFASWFLYLFNMPLALVGVAPRVAMIIIPFIQLYQFWIHTRLIKRLGPLEGVFNTPSNHRVHHGINPEYVDRNYGAILMIWDRMFGTYAAEKSPVVYGVLKPLKSWNPVWASIAPWRDLLSTGSWLAWFKRPGWNPKTGMPPDVPALFAVVRHDRFQPRLDQSSSRIAFVVFLTILFSAAVYLFLVPQLSNAQCLAISAVLVVALSLYGGWIGRRASASRQST